MELSFLEGLRQVGDEQNRGLDAPLLAEELMGKLWALMGFLQSFTAPSGPFLVRIYCVSLETV